MSAASRSVILDHWDMWSSRNQPVSNATASAILDHWDMWSSRNQRQRRQIGVAILDHWDMWYSRNRASCGRVRGVELELTHFRGRVLV